MKKTSDGRPSKSLIITQMREAKEEWQVIFLPNESYLQIEWED
jgi:hypothetical protein